jgi:hypothetical protein
VPTCQPLGGPAQYLLVHRRHARGGQNQRVRSRATLVVSGHHFPSPVPALHDCFQNAAGRSLSSLQRRVKTFKAPGLGPRGWQALCLTAAVGAIALHLTPPSRGRPASGPPLTSNVRRQGLSVTTPMPINAMNGAPSLKCPSCGFAVFNRRYPKCERCGALLPSGMAYSSEEVAALRKREKAEEVARRAEAPRATPTGGDDASWLYFSSSGGSSDSGCSSDSGSCGGGD